jgi:hypothetical protein
MSRIVIVILIYRRHRPINFFNTSLLGICRDEWVEYPQVASASCILGRLGEYLEVHFCLVSEDASPS